MLQESSSSTGYFTCVIAPASNKRLKYYYHGALQLLIATEGSRETTMEGSRMTAMEGSKLTTVEGSNVTATEVSKVTAMEGSNVTAMEGSRVTAVGGSEETLVVVFKMDRVERAILGKLVVFEEDLGKYKSVEEVNLDMLEMMLNQLLLLVEINMLEMMLSRLLLLGECFSTIAAFLPAMAGIYKTGLSTCQTIYCL